MVWSRAGNTVGIEAARSSSSTPVQCGLPQSRLSLNFSVGRPRAFNRRECPAISIAPIADLCSKKSTSSAISRIFRKPGDDLRRFILCRHDAMSSADGQEGREPFLDRTPCHFASSVPKASQKERPNRSSPVRVFSTVYFTRCADRFELKARCLARGERDRLTPGGREPRPSRSLVE